jgi:beta-phosphoglucomutase-like phosphatase (HAD superfamily)
MPLAVATNGPRAVVSDALERVGLRYAFEAVISAESL